MEDLGNWLRTAREAKGLSLQDVEAVTRIRARYLEALEVENYTAMPGGEAQVRGFLRRYASFLGLSPEEAIARYEQEVPKGREEAAPIVPLPPRPVAPSPQMPITPSPWHRLQVPGAIAAVVLLVLAGLVLLSRSGLFSPSHATPPSAVPTDVLQPIAESPVPHLTPTGVSVPPQVTPVFPVAAGGGITLTLQPLEHVWVRVTVDGFTAFEGMLAPGSPQTWTAGELVIVETGNGAGVVAVINGQPQGPLCGRGEVCARGWGPAGEVNVPAPSVLPSTPETGSP